MQLLLASNNAGKLRQLAKLLERVSIELLRPADLGLTLDVDEDGDTYSANAAKKALAFARASGRYALADDSGLEIPALGNWPGLHSVRFAGPNTDVAQRQAMILRRVAALPSEDRRARFVGVIALADPRRIVVEAVGISRGRIVAPRGTGGFGYDPIFEPEGQTLTLAEMSPEEANQISHRGIALREILPTLRRLTE